jgi:hypothetical protein
LYCKTECEKCNVRKQGVNPSNFYLYKGCYHGSA